jgi:hypothetical protein
VLLRWPPLPQCMLGKCGGQIVRCVTDSTCKAALDCLGSCEFNDQVRAAGCEGYESWLGIMAGHDGTGTLGRVAARQQRELAAAPARCSLAVLVACRTARVCWHAAVR